MLDELDAGSEHEVFDARGDEDLGANGRTTRDAPMSCVAFLLCASSGTPGGRHQVEKFVGGGPRCADDGFWLQPYCSVGASQASRWRTRHKHLHLEARPVRGPQRGYRPSLQCRQHHLPGRLRGHAHRSRPDGGGHPDQVVGIGAPAEKRTAGGFRLVACGVVLRCGVRRGAWWACQRRASANSWRCPIHQRRRRS